MAFVSTVTLYGGDPFSSRKTRGSKFPSLKSGLFWGSARPNGICYAGGFR